MTILNKLMFLWNQRNKKEIPIDNPNHLIFDNGTYECRISPNDNTEMMIYRYSTDDTDLKNEKDALQLVQSISKKYPKINTFTIEISNNNSLMFNKNKDGEINIIKEPTEAEKKSEKNNGPVQQGILTAKRNKKNTDKLLNKNLSAEEQNEIKSKIRDTNSPEDIKSLIEWIDTRDFEDIEIPEFNDINEELSLGTKEEFEEILNASYDGLEDVDDEWFKRENSDDESITNHKGDITSKNFGKCVNKNGMGNLYTVQAIIPFGDMRLVNNMYNDVIKNLSIIYYRNRNKKESFKDIEQKIGKKGYDLLESKGNNDLAELCKIYAKFLKNWKEHNGGDNVIGSAPFHRAMTSYFPEILTPFIISYYNGNPIKNGKEAIDTLIQKVGGEQIFNENNIYVSFPQSTSNMLFDSVLYFKTSNNNNPLYKCIRLSTKGGKNGLGASASISGLKSYFYDKEFGVMPTKIFSKSRSFFNASLYPEYYRPYMKAYAKISKENEKALKILSAFMLATKSKAYMDIINYIYDSEKSVRSFYNQIKKNSKYSNEISKIKSVERYLNENKIFEDCVLKALRYASYDFAQVNCFENPQQEDMDFHYDVSIQYPALFNGKINFELYNSNGLHKLMFHIIGNN